MTLWATLGLTIMTQYVKGDSWVMVIKAWLVRSWSRPEVVWRSGAVDVFGVSESSESRDAGSNLACAAALQIFDVQVTWRAD